jgi:putative endonuclease
MDKNQIGPKGEALARQHLEQQGYVILAQNWRPQRPLRGELDLVAQQGEILVFVEVKTLARNTFGYPDQQVDRRKERLWWQTACAYVGRLGYEGELRFDLIAITLEPFELRHYQDVLFPMG